jgi:hypothetical protein
MPDKPVPAFTEEDFQRVVQALPEDIDQGRAALLPSIIKEWNANILPEYSWSKPPANIKDRVRRTKSVGVKAEQLLKALKALDGRDRFAIAFAIAKSEERKFSAMSKAEHELLLRRISDEIAFLRILRQAALQAWKRKRGGPRNITAYLFLQDAAALFEWLTDKKATRGVDRIDNSETGPFWRVVSVLWPLMIGTKGGLPSAMKNWAAARNKFGERSALMANMHLRHPTWGVFKRDSEH